jgi:hypothetical protein
LGFLFSLSALVFEHWRLTMAREPRVNFSMQELDRLKCIQAVIDGDLKPGRAAERLRLTVRQIERLVIRYRDEGPIGLVSRHRNRPGNRSLKARVAEHAISLMRERYADFGPTLAAEKLRTRHHVILAKETVRQLQIASGLVDPEDDACAEGTAAAGSARMPGRTNPDRRL